MVPEALAAVWSALDSLARRALERPLTLWRAWHRDEPRTSQRRVLQLIPHFRTVFVFGGNRSGKTELLRAVLVALVLGSDHPDAASFWRAHDVNPAGLPKGPGNGWIVALRANDSLEYHRKQVVALLPQWGPRHELSEGEGSNWHAWGLAGKDEARLEIRVPGYDKPATIVFKSDDPGDQIMQGASCRVILHDEESRKHGDKTWEECSVRLIDQRGWHLMANTPTLGRTWVYTDHVIASHEDEVCVWIHSPDNPYLAPSEVKKLERNPIVAAIRMRGEFVALEGRVWPMFSRVVHVVPTFEIPSDEECIEADRKVWTRYRGIDFGTRHPFVCTHAASPPEDYLLPDGRTIPAGALVMYRERYVRECTLGEHVNAIRAGEGADKHEEATSEQDRWTGGEDIAVTWVDPEDPQQMLQLAHTYGFEVTRANRAISAGIGVVADMLLPGIDGRPSLFVMDCCVNGIREAEAYCWGERGQSEVPVGQSDHAMDTWRYLAMGHRVYSM